MSLMPRLMALDEQVLEAVPEYGATRARRVAQEVSPRASYSEVCEILRGLQQFGYVRQGRGGWWRRA